MANYTTQPNYQTQIKSLGRQRDLTQALMGQVLAPQENSTGLTALARILSAHLANKKMTSLDEQEKALAEQQAKARNDELARVLGMTQDRPAETAQPNVFGPPAPARKGVPLEQALLQSKIPEFQDMGLKRSLEAKANAAQIGTYNPRDYTEDSFSEFVKTGDTSVLKRYESQRNVMIGDVPYVFDPARGGYFAAQVGGAGATAQPPKPITAQDVAENRAAIVGAETTARAEAETKANQGSKAPVLDSMQYVMDQYTELFPKITTGGVLGVKGKISSVFDSQDAMRMENLNQQLSTELRTVFRIPGEGTLSDREQAQYGLQLPSLNYDQATNEAILTDLKTRAALRTGQDEGPTTPRVEQNQGGGIKLLRVRDK
jgi:hypothetical protein